MEKSITVITPTYNRAHTIYNCYESLINQTEDSFIWTIIDDGSTDHTEELVKYWIEEQKIDINYIKKSNGGKASALNLAFENLSTEFWVCLDSDDTFADNAIEMAICSLKKIDNTPQLCGVIALRNAPNGEVMGNKRIPENLKEVTTLELWNEHNIRSEYIQFYKTKITKNYRFPEIEGEKFITPEYLAHMLSRKYKFLVSQNTFCYCEYLDDGLTNNKDKVIKNNPKGYTLIMHSGFENSETFKAKSMWCVKYISGSILSGDKLSETLRKSPEKTMALFYYPLGWVAFKLRFNNASLRKG